MTIITTFPGGLILRAATPGDADRLAEFNIRIHSDEPDSPQESLGVWTRDLLVRDHPTFQAGLTTIVEDPANGKIVSTALIIPQTWSYGGIPFGVARPELIATDPEYRGRGLVRAQMDVLHGWSTELGHQMQAITGIPWFYRQFGYEMCLELGGGRTGYNATLPKLANGEREPVRFRPATIEDVPFFLENYPTSTVDERFACLRTAEEWAYDIAGKSPDNINRLEVRIMETPGGKPVGYAVHPPKLSGSLMELSYAGITPELTWREAAPALLRHIRKTGHEYAALAGITCEGLTLSLGSSHPIFDLFPNNLPKVRNPYAWYLRVPNLPGFLRLISPVLEERLAASAMRGYSGEVRLGFYRSGLHMTFEAGCLTNVEDWTPSANARGDVLFPDLTFLLMLCGRRTFAELSDFFADCYTQKSEISALLTALFPRQASNVWAIS